MWTWVIIVAGYSSAALGFSLGLGRAADAMQSWGRVCGEGYRRRMAGRSDSGE